MDEDLTKYERELAGYLRNPFYTVRSFHQALGGTVGIHTIRAAVRSGLIRTVRVGRKYLIPKTELVRLAELRELK
jgi:excisionase family DNA binding protein